MALQNQLTLQHLLRHPEKLARFEKVRIWSGEWKQWWMPNGQSYSPNIEDAGIYDVEDAFKRTRHCGPEKKIKLVAVSQETTPINK